MMNRLGLVTGALLLFAGTAGSRNTAATEPEQTQASNASIGWATNGPAVYGLRSSGFLPGPPVSYAPLPTNLPPEIRGVMLTFRAAVNVTVLTEKVFDHLLPESLNNAVWTNFIAHTNGGSTVVWSTRMHPPGWPAQAPVAQWNTNCLMWGMKGMTALSPCWEVEGSQGQVPITALTRRHGYARGHGMGPDRIGTAFAGKKVWLLTTQNTLVLRIVRREVVRTAQVSGRDYTIVLFGSDLPDTVQPMRVVAPDLVFSFPRTKYVFSTEFPCPMFKTEQLGHVSADVPGFTLDTFKGGDSGSPNMLPLPGELIFWTGRSTSGAGPEMQSDMDQLCRLEGLDPRRYQLQWVDLSGYPTY